MPGIVDLGSAVPKIKFPLGVVKTPEASLRRNIHMAIVFDKDGKYVDEKGFVKLDPTMY